MHMQKYQHLRQLMVLPSPPPLSVSSIVVL